MRDRRGIKAVIGDRVFYIKLCAYRSRILAGAA
jgi:hypothetical protein